MHLLDGWLISWCCTIDTPFHEIPQSMVSLIMSASQMVRHYFIYKVKLISPICVQNDPINYLEPSKDQSVNMVSLATINWVASRHEFNLEFTDLRRLIIIVISIEDPLLFHSQDIVLSKLLLITSAYSQECFVDIPNGVLMTLKKFGYESVTDGREIIYRSTGKIVGYLDGDLTCFEEKILHLNFLTGFWSSLIEINSTFVH